MKEPEPIDPAGGMSGTVRPYDHLPYARPLAQPEDIASVISVLKSEWWTTGPVLRRFEKEMSKFCHCAEAVAVSSGTAALHCAYHAIGIGPGDEVIVPAMTFSATANAVVLCGGTPVFADVDADTLLIDPVSIETKITPRTRAIVGVDYAGQPCDYDALAAIATEYRLSLVSDACHSLGGSYHGRVVGSLADVTVFSFHAVKAVAAGEGGMVVTNRTDWAEKIRKFRNHGILTDPHQRSKTGTWEYDLPEIGFNYRLTDIQAALALSQLKKLGKSISRKHAIAGFYDTQFAPQTGIGRLQIRTDVTHAHHLYVVRIKGKGEDSRDRVFHRLRHMGIGVNVHYKPVHLLSFYRNRYGCKEGDCPHAEAAYRQILSLPLHPGMTDADAERVVQSVRKTIHES